MRGSAAGAQPDESEPDFREFTGEPKKMPLEFVTLGKAGKVFARYKPPG